MGKPGTLNIHLAIVISLTLHHIDHIPLISNVLISRQRIGENVDILKSLKGMKLTSLGVGFVLIKRQDRLDYCGRTYVPTPFICYCLLLLL